jgi:WD40 repeat protein/tRNA A-37 threonylcarbamoyl transferase component Bud32
VRERDPEATIDAAADAAAPQATSEPVTPSARAVDYGELLAVDRQHYVVDGEIAKGGMGRVIAARDRRLGREVAIKELLPKNRDATRRFEREARITARLQHPSIIHVYEAGVWPGGEPFYAMHKVSGRSLDKVVAERATLNERLGLLPHVIAVADALAYAHSQRVVHRDLKPSNVLVGDFGETVVIDWGLAKDLEAPELGESHDRRARAESDETLSGSVVGTPSYMPPEQARGEIVDERADVYALGALLYKVLVGHAPYAGASSADVLEQVKGGPPLPVDQREPGTPPDLAAIVTKAMARDRETRYATAGELAADLKRFQTGQLVAAHRYTAGQLFWRWLRRRLLAVSIGAAAIIAIAIIATLSVRRIVEEKGRAEAGRAKLLEERGRSELLAGNPGKALAYLVEAARDGVPGGARGFLIADAMRPFAARNFMLAGGPLVAVTADGKHVATAGDDAVKLWTIDGKLERQLGDHRGRIRVLAWNDTGTQLVAAGEQGVAWVWTSGGDQIAELRGHTATIRDAAFGAGGKLVTASADGTAIVWNVATAGTIATSTCHSSPVVSARFSSDGEHVVTGSEDGTACVWSARTGATETPLRGHTGPIESATWANDDRWIVTASDDGTARVWSAERGKLVVQPLRHDTGSVVRVAIVSHDGRRVLTAGNDRIARIWTLPARAPDDGLLPTPRPITMSGHTDAITSAVFSDDDSLVATGSLDHFATIWDPQRGQALRSFEHADVVESVAFTAGHGALVTGTRDGRGWLRDVGDDKARYELDSPVHAIAVAKDGTIAAGTDDSNITLVRGDGRRDVLRGHLGRVLALVATPDGSKLVSAGEDPRPIVWDVATAQRIGELGEHQLPVLALAISRDGKRVATASGDSVRVWSLDGKLEHAFTDSAATITAVAFSPSGDRVEAGTDDGTVVAWRLRANAEPVVLHNLPTAITAIGHAPCGSLVVASAGHVELYPPLAGDSLGRGTVLDNPGEVRAAAFTADGSLVVTAGGDGAKIWDAATGKLLGTRGAHGRAHEALALERDTLWLASGDGTLAAWDLAINMDAPEVLAEFVRAHDPWILDKGNDLVQQGSH